jgi:monoamine oxidase
MKIKRRTFIKDALIAGTGAAIAPQLLLAQPAVSRGIKTNNTIAGGSGGKKVIVAGAGITGLCCAYELVKAGHEVVVLEASGRYGGHVFTGRDGLSDGLYADFGADHITKPGYERFFDYVREFNLTLVPYPNAEGSQAAYDPDALKMIGGKFYSAQQLKDPVLLGKLGFNEKETGFLSQNPMYALSSFYLKPYLGKFKDQYQPFGVGYDEWDNVPIADIFKKEGASAAALRLVGGQNISALYYLWRMAIMDFRGIPASEGDTYHLNGGNEQLPMAFAKRLAGRLKLNHPVTAIEQSSKGVRVSYKAYGTGQQKQMDADFLVNCITMPVFRNIPVSPALSPAKQYVVDNMAYSSHPFYVFEASSKFWLDEGIKSINMEFEHPDISQVWLETNQVDTSRIILKAFGPGGLSPARVLAAFRQVYPGKHDTIEQALTLDWTRDKFAPACEMEPIGVGQMRKFWPQIMLPEGRIYFAGTYADNMSRGMESCLRSAQRVAGEISKI